MLHFCTSTRFLYFQLILSLPLLRVSCSLPVCHASRTVRSCQWRNWSHKRFWISLESSTLCRIDTWEMFFGLGWWQLAVIFMFYSSYGKINLLKRKLFMLACFSSKEDRLKANHMFSFAKNFLVLWLAIFNSVNQEPVNRVKQISL